MKLADVNLIKDILILLSSKLDLRMEKMNEEWQAISANMPSQKSETLLAIYQSLNADDKKKDAIDRCLKTLKSNGHICSADESTFSTKNVTHKFVITDSGVNAMLSNYYLFEFYKFNKSKSDSDLRKLPIIPIVISLLSLLVTLYSANTTKTELDNHKEQIENLSDRLQETSDSLRLINTSINRPSKIDTPSKKQ